MNEEIDNSLTVSAGPTKRFFVDMLTRDIELEDAVLDLLDNCVDGIQRTFKGELDLIKPYKGFWAKIKFTNNKFSIIDNCGGIPKKLAEKYAFRMGRPKDEDDSDIPTVGMYGIGMKRAIFKMGTNAVINSKAKGGWFKVTITEKWLKDDEDWMLPLVNQKKENNDIGTAIIVQGLHNRISKEFGSSSFIDHFRKLVSQHYGFIINKGFDVFVNDKKILPVDIKLLRTDIKNTSDDARLVPFLYKGIVNGVNVKLAVGFYTPMVSPEDDEAEAETTRSTKSAGWTIICNDRVVVHNDRTRLTGWGVAGVPNYHTQFIGLLGVVIFESNDAWMLPVTTTKRGIDPGSDTYLYVKEFMIQGLKKFTSYTNKWKKDYQGEREISSAAVPVTINNLFSEMTDNKLWTNVKNKQTEQKLDLPLPTPRDSDPTRRVVFSKSLRDIQLVSEYLFENSNVSPSDVGAECFDIILRKAK